jgi:hypothetical protein
MLIEPCNKYMYSFKLPRFLPLEKTYVFFQINKYILFLCLEEYDISEQREACI